MGTTEDRRRMGRIQVGPIVDVEEIEIGGDGDTDKVAARNARAVRTSDDYQRRRRRRRRPSTETKLLGNLCTDMWTCRATTRRAATGGDGAENRQGRRGRDNDLISISEHL
ncbi:hypothetical protein RB195_007400 [Necator americanus]|uniref:Uncharacterized protein n=1 Tax=Necator americanus TaxID=51031 RepID=A0ABR1C007_NECAM